MHPAKSVIAFTTMTGAGYGLLIFMIALHMLGLIPTDATFALTGFGLAFALITIGLMVSALHLGRPERAWRAFTQWRSSWLSREGVLAVITYGPTGLYGLVWYVYPQSIGTPFMMAVGVFGILCCVGTVFCTSMIYASLKAICTWANPWVPVSYLLLSLMTGALLCDALVYSFGYGTTVLDIAVLVLLGLGLAVKLVYWKCMRETACISTPETAIGLPTTQGGMVRLLEAPHTQDNYLLKEMGFVIARKHAAKLRKISVITGFMLPVFLVWISSVLAPSIAGYPLMSAVFFCAVGVVVERWLFFAEAHHVVMMYYGHRPDEFKT